jgi:hypothetical protein
MNHDAPGASVTGTGNANRCRGKTRAHSGCMAGRRMLLIQPFKLNACGALRAWNPHPTNPGRYPTNWFISKIGKQMESTINRTTMAMTRIITGSSMAIMLMIDAWTSFSYTSAIL